MCSTCGCKGAETLEAPMTRYDEYCISCGDDCGANSNLCMKCQKMFGVKKASNRMIARLGLGAESFEAMDCPRCDSMYCEGDCSEYWEGESFSAETLEDLTKDQLIDLIRGLEDREVYVKDFIDKSAESFEAQRKLTDIDRDGKPYTGQIYPDHPDLDSTKADRNKDGYMSSWERALGNQVARGMEKYKSERKKPMKRMKMRNSSKKSTSILPSVVVVGLIAAVVGSKIRK